MHKEISAWLDGIDDGELDQVNDTQQRLTDQFWHLEPGIDKISESRLRQLVNAQLSLLEKGKRAVSKREELISLATAEAYTFLIHYLHALFGLRSYDPKPDKDLKKYIFGYNSILSFSPSPPCNKQDLLYVDNGIARRKHEFGNWISCLNACSLMNFPPECVSIAV